MDLESIESEKLTLEVLEQILEYSMQLRLQSPARARQLTDKVKVKGHGNPYTK